MTGSLGLVFLLMNTLASSAATWEPIASLPEPNGGFVAGALGNRPVVCGGTNWRDDTKRWLDRCWMFDADGNTWRGRLPLSSPVAYAVAGHADDEMWFAAGSSGTATHGTLSRMDDAFNITTVATGAPRVVYAGGTVLDGSLFIIGGAADQARLETLTNTCFALDLKSGRVTRLPDLPLPSFGVGAVAACAGRVFVFGGARWDAASNNVANLDSVFALAPGDRAWKKLPPLPAAVRGINAVALDGRHIYLGGGYLNDAEEFTDQAFVFDARAETLRPAVPLPHRAMTSLVVAGDWLYCLGGEDRKKSRTAAAFRIPVKALRVGEGRSKAKG
jgi:hypothetical protein